MQNDVPIVLCVQSSDHLMDGFHVFEFTVERAAQDTTDTNRVFVNQRLGTRSGQDEAIGCHWRLSGLTFKVLAHFVPAYLDVGAKDNVGHSLR